MADRHLIDVHVLLVRDRKLLLIQRRGTFGNDMWQLPAGKLDAGESVLDAAVREANEEVGVVIDPAELRSVHTIHVNGSGPEPRLGLFFEAQRWIGRSLPRTELAESTIATARAVLSTDAAQGRPQG